MQDLVIAAAEFGRVLGAGGTVWIMGNGGSAGDAQHLSSEMVGRMIMERRPLSAVALSADISAITAIGNDYGYEQVFSRQIEGLVRAGDIVVAISTSGNSKNVLLGIEAARKKKAWILGLTGGSGGAMASKCDLILTARLGKNSSRIQEAHRFAIHAIVDTLDRYFLD